MLYNMAKSLASADDKTPFLVDYDRTYNAKCVKVVDGDSAHLVIDFGGTLFYNFRCRLDGYNAPEKRKAGYSEYKKKLSTLIKNRPCQIRITAVDKYDRFMIILFVNSVNVNEFMIHFDAKYKNQQ